MFKNKLVIGFTDHCIGSYFYFFTDIISIGPATTEKSAYCHRK